MHRHPRYHPEARKNEVYLGNATRDAFYNVWGWNTRRMGLQAYDIYGNPLKSIEGLYPVFVQRREIEAEIRDRESEGMTVAALRHLISEE